MRDLHLRHTLKTLARDASAVFSEITDEGQEIPYEIAEPDGSMAFCQYRPLTAKFVRDNATELRELETFREATDTMRGSDLAAAYLEEAGIAPPADGIERATLAVTYFLARLWDGCSDFDIDEDRFSAALDEIEQCSEPQTGEIEAIVPLVGFQSTESRIELRGAAIVRADTVDVPAEAARSERPAGAEWQPTFLISTRISLDSDGGLAGAGDRVAKTFERVVTTLRLHKSGGVGLGPHGWVRVAGDRWRRIATGSARPRTGGYELGSDEIPELTDLARTVSVHPKRLGRLRRPLLRFESGLDRRGAVDALNDHLLGLRFLLEGEGPAGVGLPMRAAALATDGEERTETKLAVEQAIALERELWSGEPVKSGGLSPSQLAARIEGLLRTILRRGISGELGADLRAAADETLLADGLAVGEGATARGSTSEWQVEELLERDEVSPDATEAEPETTETEIVASETFAPERVAAEPKVEEEPASVEPEHDAAQAFDRFEADPEAEIVASRPVDAGPANEPEPEISDQQWIEAMQQSIDDEEDQMSHSSEDGQWTNVQDDVPDWLEEVDAPKVTMAFPKPDPSHRQERDNNHIDELSKPPMEREQVKARVEYLFPRTETNWAVGGTEPARQAKAG